MIPRWIVTRVKISRWIVTPGHDSTLNCDPGSWFHVELWSQVKLWPGIGITIQWVILTRVIIQRGILTRGHNSTWNSDPSTYLLPVELRLKKVSNFNSVIKIQQLRRVTIQRKIHWILTPGRYSIGGSKFYLTGNSYLKLVRIHINSHHLLLYIISMNILLLMNFILNSICMGITELWGMASHWKIQTENLWIQQDSKPQPLAPQTGSLDHSATLTVDEMFLKVL